MHDELTQVDIQKMQDEIDYRTKTLRPQLIEEVKRRVFETYAVKLSPEVRIIGEE